MAQQQQRRPRDPSEIQADIERAREEITQSVLALRERVSRAADWREWIRRRPVVLVIAALAIGAFVGLRRRR